MWIATRKISLQNLILDIPKLNSGRNRKRAIIKNTQLIFFSWKVRKRTIPFFYWCFLTAIEKTYFVCLIIEKPKHPLLSKYKVFITLILILKDKTIFGGCSYTYKWCGCSRIFSQNCRLCTYNRLFKFKYTINGTQKFESLDKGVQKERPVVIN